MEDGALRFLSEHIESLKRKRRRLTEKSLGHLSELAELLCEDAPEEEIFFKDEAFIGKYKSLTSYKESDEPAPFNRRAVNGEEYLLSHAERALLCMDLCEIFGIKGIKDASTFFDIIPPSGDSTVSYVKTPATDSAFLLFAPALRNPRTVYADDFNEECENVYYGKTEYCILPVASSVDGRLAGFRNLALKYGLKNVRICNVKNPDDTVSVFALMKKELEIPSEGEPFFEFAIKDKVDITEITAAARVCGLKTVSVFLSPELDGLLNMAVRTNEDGICGFLCYLHLEHPDFIPLGIFSEA